MKIYLIYTVIILAIFSCSQDKIEISKEYLVNPNWKSSMINPMLIEGMEIKKDSILEPFSKLSQSALLSKLKVDSQYNWSGNVSVSVNKEEILASKTIFFSKNNGFEWWNDVTGEQTYILGDLKNNKWYRFSGLVGAPYLIYVYIDSTGQAHRFDVNISNY